MFAKPVLPLVLLLVSQTAAVKLPQSPLHTPELLKVESRSGTKFRTKSCADSAPRRSFVNWFGLGEEDVEMMDMVTVHEPSASPRVACAVFSHSGARQEQRDSYATWGQDCDDFLVFSDEKFSDEETGVTSIKIHTPLSDDDDDKDEFNMVGKQHEVFKEIHRRVQGGKLHFDFLAVGGDDTLWVIPNLKHMLSTDERILAAREEGKGLVYGRMAVARGSKGFAQYIQGGGYVLDQKAIEEYLAQWNDAELNGKWNIIKDGNGIKNHGPGADLNLGRAMHMAGVPLIHDLESDGKHHFHVWEEWASDPTRDWIPEDMKLQSFPQPFAGKNGKDAISTNSVLFHSHGKNKVVGQRRYNLHDQIYRKLTCKA